MLKLKLLFLFSSHKSRELGAIYIYIFEVDYAKIQLLPFDWLTREREKRERDEREIEKRERCEK